MIIYILAKMVGVEGLVLLLPAIVSLIYREKSGFCFLIVSAVLILIYFLLGRKVPKNKRIYAKDGLVIVGAAWILWSLFGAVPFQGAVQREKGGGESPTRQDAPPV